MRLPRLLLCSTVSTHHNGTMDSSEKFEAIGQRGEACIIVMRRHPLPNGQVGASYTLATGEKLRPTDAPGEYTTMDGTRTFRLRNKTG